MRVPENESYRVLAAAASVVRLRFGVARWGEFNACLCSKVLYGLVVGQSVDSHDEVEDVAVGPASEAVIAAASYGRRDAEVCELLRMEWTRGIELVVANWTQSDVAADHKIKAARLPDSLNVFFERRRCHRSNCRSGP